MLDGWMENALVSEPATAVEDRYREILRASRARDAAAGRTLDGPHLTDLQVIYAPKNMPARDASTGEQKALLIGLVLAHAGLVADMTGITPLLLLDEVVAHLDPGRRTALFDELAKLGAQVWMTGADPAAFADIGATGEIFDVDSGRIARRGRSRSRMTPVQTSQTAGAGHNRGSTNQPPRLQGAAESRFSRRPESASGRLEKPRKIPFIQ